MRSMSVRWKGFVSLVSLACLLIVSGNATATDVSKDQATYVVSGTAAQFYGYVTPLMVVEARGRLDLVNFDIVQHDVVHDVAADGIANKKKNKWCRAFKKGRCPLFWSARAGLGGSVPVKGLRNLTSGGIYSFYCTLHPGMKGKLVVR